MFARRACLIAVVALATALLAPSAASAKFGDLDTSFGGLGFLSYANAIKIGATAVQPDGKVVQAGYTHDSFNNRELAYVQRYEADGDLDPTFNGGGLIVINLTNPSFTSTQLFKDVAIAPDGKIVLGGSFAATVGGAQAALIVRLTSGGTFDTSFNGTGYITSAAGSGEARSINAVDVLSDGAVVAAGQIYAVASTPSDYPIIYRLNENGTFDSPFITNASLSNQVTHGTENFSFTGVTALPGDKFAATGYVGGKGIVKRYTSSGDDTSFGSSGERLIDPLSGTATIVPRAITARPGGGVAIAGEQRVTGPSTRAFIGQLTPDGALDTTFSDDGIASVPLTPESGDRLESIAALPNGRLIAAGKSDRTSPTPTTVTTLLEVNPDGTPSTALSPTGIRAYDFPFVTDDNLAASVSTMADGRIVVGGPVGANSLWAARLLADSPPAVSFTFGQPLSEGATLSPSIVLNVTASDDSGAPPTCDRVSGAAVPLAVGLNTIAVTCTDGGGYSTTATAQVTRNRPSAVAAITSPAKSTIKASKLKALAGTVKANAQVEKVEVALQRVDAKLLKKKKQCLWLKNSKSKFANVKAVKKKCSAPKWLAATGTSTWSYKIKKLPKGSYVLSVRATPTGGEASKPIVKKFKLT